jgi:osmoprotectant transport system substrate-binding protein
MVGCTNAPDSMRARRDDADTAVVVASFNFPESTLLAEIYAFALEHAGVRVRRELDLGPRELVEPALYQGYVDVVPEYVGSALAAVDPTAAAESPDVETAHAVLATALSSRHLRVLAPAPAQNQNAVVVTRRTAQRFGLVTVSDLARVAQSLRIGGPPECPTRPYCLLGLRQRYGLQFKAFVPLGGAARTQRALDDGVVDVGILFTTDGHLATQDLVLLDDDRHLQPPENVVPVVREEVVARYGTRVVEALDAVSGHLTTTALRLLNWRVSVAGNDPRVEARAWLVRRGLVSR